MALPGALAALCTVALSICFAMTIVTSLPLASHAESRIASGRLDPAAVAAYTSYYGLIRPKAQAGRAMSTTCRSAPR